MTLASRFVDFARALCGPPCASCLADGAECCSCEITREHAKAIEQRVSPERSVRRVHFPEPGKTGHLELSCGHTQATMHFANGAYPKRVVCFDCGRACSLEP